MAISASTVLKALAAAGVCGGVGYVVYRTVRKPTAVLPAPPVADAPPPAPKPFKASTMDAPYQAVLMDGYAAGAADRSVGAPPRYEDDPYTRYEAKLSGESSLPDLHAPMRATLHGNHGYVLTKDPSAMGPSGYLDVVLRIDAWRQGYAEGYEGRKPNTVTTSMAVWPTTINVLKADGWVTNQFWVTSAVTAGRSLARVRHGVTGSRGATLLGNFSGRTR